MSHPVSHAVALAFAAAAFAGHATVAVAAPPTVANAAVTENKAREVVFTAAVNPGGEATTVRLEYGADPSLGARSGAVDVGSGSDPVLVTVTLRAQPDSTYHWRFAAENPSGAASSETQSIRTPPEPRSGVLPGVRLGFAVQTLDSRRLLGRLVGVTRPRGLPLGTRITIRCRRACEGGRSFRVRRSSRGGQLLRFRPAVQITRRSVVEVRAVRRGYVGRLRRYVFRRSSGLLVPFRIASRCLTDTRPPRRTACRPTR